MKFKALATAAVLAATTLLAAGPASADPPRQRGDFARNASITLLTPRGVMEFDRSDRAFWRLTRAPYNFAPGYAYRYTDRCNNRGCTVLVYREHGRRPIDRIFAPFLPHHRVLAGEARQEAPHGGGWRDDDRRYDGRRGEDDRGRDDNRDGRYDQRGDDSGLDGGPRSGGGRGGYNR